ncbi:hypothetical protein GSI_02655 [Ganoderma sinense ZZ0214-1]|uniref:Uncharacterized protein n=1 Tax=Ganoderma sinense ZZ0214-1 TaxID=1077348 RepID=A0A2G8SMR8_9APHY|nr:hypothetical protein GSI_02655 [Ganoderma sinense ZZ0214-1]
MDPSANTSSSRVPGSSSSPASASIAALPSLAHSLSSFPNMTFVTNDMVHYGNLGRTKGASQAKLNSALRITKQRQVSTAPPGALAMMSAPSLPPQTCAPYPTPDDEDPVLLLVPKRSKAAKRSS